MGSPLGGSSAHLWEAVVLTVFFALRCRTTFSRPKAQDQGLAPTPTLTYFPLITFLTGSYPHSPATTILYHFLQIQLPWATCLRARRPVPGFRHGVLLHRTTRNPLAYTGLSGAQPKEKSSTTLPIVYIIPWPRHVGPQPHVQRASETPRAANATATHPFSRVARPS